MQKTPPLCDLAAILIEETKVIQAQRDGLTNKTKDLVLATEEAVLLRVLNQIHELMGRELANVSA
jgi:hypothetical protein